MTNFSNGHVSLVLTSIAAPNPVMRALAKESLARGISFYVMGDVPSPTDFHLEGCEFYSLKRQRETAFTLVTNLPERHYGRKNIGYLLAIQKKSQLILETDDDNMPSEGFWAPRLVDQKVRFVRNTGWTNAYAFFSDANIWPRGLPLDAIGRSVPAYDGLREEVVCCPIQQGVVNGDPDVDAVYRLVLPAPLPITFRDNRKVALGQGAWCPFNSQNTAWFPRAYPLMYLPSFCSFRMTDIWRSFVAQIIAWENGWTVLFTSPDMYQDRNEHNLMRDFADEVPGYLHNTEIGAALASLKLAPGENNLGDNLVRCYEELVRKNWVGEGEIALVRAWVHDLDQLS